MAPSAAAPLNPREAAASRRCSSIPPRILIDGKWKYYDPLDHADDRYEAKINYIR
jgi:hypothetical protein